MINPNQRVNHWHIKEGRDQGHGHDPHRNHIVGISVIIGVADIQHHDIDVIRAGHGHDHGIHIRGRRQEGSWLIFFRFFKEIFFVCVYV